MSGKTEPPPPVAFVGDDASALAAVCEATADQTGVPLEIVEKDYWATRCLAAASRAPGPVKVVLKGGTSLSKALHLIDRFSEDVDLIVLFDPALSNNATKKAFRSVADHVSHEVGCGWRNEREGRGFLNARYSYRTDTVMALFDEGVLLEMGNRGGPHPSEAHRVEALLASTAREHFGLDLPDVQPFDVTVLAAERTLVEKLDALHGAASLQDAKRLTTGARHLYDIARLLTDETVIQRCAAGAVTNLIDDVNERSAAAGWPAVPRPAGGYADSPAFNDRDAIAAIAAGWNRVNKLVFGEKIHPDDAIAIIHAHREVL